MSRSPEEQARAVEEAILRPMRAIYPPPVHLRGDPDALRLALDTYRRGLARFERPVLEAAWQLAAEGNEYWTWPKLSDLIGHAQEIKRQEQRRNGTGRPASDERIEQAVALSDAYTRSFMKSSRLAGRSKAEGWERQLRAYVQEAAWVQAEFICGVPAVGYSATLFNYPHISAEECREQAETFLTAAREQAEKGHIRVHVPPRMVQQWTAGAAKGSPRTRG